MVLVAPFTGAWIEICIDDDSGLMTAVAPFTGAWVETMVQDVYKTYPMSHPSRVRGLKCQYPHYLCHDRQGRTLHGCVD